MAFVDPNPSPGNQFGNTVVPLSTGNVVITAPFDDAGGIDAGAVYLFNGSTGVLISTLRGSHDFDVIGQGGVTALANGNFVIGSPSWQNGGQHVGAVTWGSGTTGVSGTVNASNSLIGSTAGDAVGGVGTIHELTNGNYVVRTSAWDNGTSVDVGAVTWGNGTTGVVGTISSSNSLIGAAPNSHVGSHGVKALSNGNYVVISSSWASDTGAVTFGNGAAGITGTLSSSNSLVGVPGSQVGSGGVFEVANSNYVVLSPFWDAAGATDVGAVTWSSGTTGVTGTISASNSLVGSTASDYVGMGLTKLTNGNYVVRTSAWDNAGVLNAGAATWGSGTAPLTGIVSASNSLVGSSVNDMVANQVVALSNGNYVVGSPEWSSATAGKIGAVTWANGTTGRTGVVNASNSLTGSVTNDRVGSGNGIYALSNGHYVVASPEWDSGGISNAGGVTWADGTTGLVGTVSAANSLIGSQANDGVGSGGVTPLTNGNYVVGSPLWKSGAVLVGAATWRNGSAASSGSVSAANSLVGSTSIDFVGEIGSVTALTNGNYVVASPNWDNGPVANVGAVTWGNGSGGTVGAISAALSLVGSSPNDRIGNQAVIPLAGGNYVVLSTSWDNAGIVDTGAATWGNGTTGVKGAITSSNSLVGSQAGDQLGINGVTALANGNYVVSSANWDNAALAQAGAVSWSSGSAGITGAVVAPSVNHVKGGTASTGLASITVDNVNGNFYARFLTEGTGVIRVGSQSTGFDFDIPGTLAAAFTTGSLSITDVDGVGKDNTLTVRIVNVSGTDYYEFTDANEAFLSAPSTSPASLLSNSNRTLRVPVSAVTGGLTFNLVGGNDALTVDLTGGDAIPAGGLAFHGSAPASLPGDQLNIVGGSQGTVTYNYTNATDGNIVMSSLGTVTYTGLEQGIVNSGSAADVVLNFPATGSAASWTDDGTAGNSLSRLSSPSFVSTSFGSPTGGVTFNRGNTNDSLALGALPDFSAALTIGTNVAQLNNVTFGGAITLTANKNLNVFANGTIGFTTTGSDVTLAGNGAASLTTTRNIALTAGASLTTAAGNLTLDANQQASATSGDFIGIDLSNAAVTSTSGSVTVRGRGGNSPVGQQQGVKIAAGSIVGGNTSGAVTVLGTGGPSIGNDNFGVWVTGASSIISSNGGGLQVTGTGGGSSNSAFNIGVQVNAGGRIAALGAGTVTVAGSSSNASGNGNIGINVFGANSAVTSNSGAVQLTGTGGGGGSGVDNWGIYVGQGAMVTAGGSASLSLSGTGGAGTGGANHGVFISADNALVSAGSAGLSINGTAGTGSTSFGVNLTGVASVAVNNGPITFLGNTLNLENTFTVNAGTGNVNIRPQTAGHPVHLGNPDSATALGLTDAELDRITAGTVFIGNFSTGNIIGFSPITHGNHLALTTGGQITLNQAVTMAANKNLTATATGGIELISTNADVATSGTGTITFDSTRNIFLAAGASVISASGAVTLDANQQATPTTGSFAGIDSSGVIDSTSGHIALRGKGGTSLLNQVGVWARGGSIGASTTGSVTVTGIGGASTGSDNRGVAVTSATITSGGGNVMVTGTGGGIGSSNNYGVSVESSGVISAGGFGTLSILGTGRLGGGLGQDNNGVNVSTLGTITSGGGAVQVTGVGGTSDGGNNLGVFVTSAGVITSGGTATVTVNGQGGLSSAAANGNVGVVVTGTNSRITSGGNVSVTGTGSASVAANGSAGVVVGTDGQIGATGVGSTLVTGTGGAGPSTSGVIVSGSITGVSGPVHVIGNAGGNASGNSSIGVRMVGGTISSAGNVRVEGYGSTVAATTSQHHGLHMMTSSVISSTAGNVNVLAVGGSGAGQSAGILMDGGSITTGAAGALTVNSTGGTGASGSNYALRMGPVGTNLIRGGDGGVNITAAAPDLATPAISLATGATIRTSAGIGNIQLATDGIDIGSGGAIDATANTVTLVPRQASWGMNLGGNDATGMVALTDSESDTITAGTLVLGNASSGLVTISGNISRPAATNLQINSSGAINFTAPAPFNALDSNGGNILLNPGTSVVPGAPFVDVATGAGTLTFGAGDDLAIDINGATVNTDYTQLNVAGTVNLTGLDLALTGNFVPLGGETFVIVNNDGTDNVIGTFNGLPQGSILSTNFLGSGLTATIGYFGGTGNDVVITVAGAPGTTSVQLSSGNLIITDVLGGDTDDNLTITRVGSNLRITDLSATVQAFAGVTQINANTVEVPLASITGNLQVSTLAGNDALTFDFSGGNPLPVGGLIYSAGAGANDSLLLTGGVTTTIAHLLTNVSDGSVTLTGPLAGTINYTGLEPLTDSLIAAARSFTMNGGAETIALADSPGPNMALTTNMSRLITFANPTASLTLDAASGSDTITVDSVDAEGPFNASLAIHGGSGDDTIIINGDITFASGRNLDLDLQNDDAIPGVDSIRFEAGANLLLSGTGAATLTASRDVVFATGSSLVTAGGAITIEANQQVTPTSGSFAGISLDNALLSTTGAAQLTLLGRGGDGVGGSQFGIVMSGGAVVSGGASGGQVTLNGRGGVSTGNGNVGVRIVGTGASVTSLGAPVQISGQGDGTGTSAQHHGVVIAGAATVSAGGTGTVTIAGTGGPTTGGNHHGIQVFAGTITSSGGNVTLTGIAGAGGLAGGVDVNLVADPGTVVSTATNGGSINIAGDNLVIGQNVSTNVAGSVTLRPTTPGLNWDLGSILPDAELDLVSTGTLHLGSATMGSMIVSANISRPVLTAMSLTAGVSIQFTTGTLDSNGGNVHLAAGSYVQPTVAGVDIRTGTGDLTFGMGTDVSIVINGPVIDTQVQRLNFAGADLVLTGADFVVSGTHTPLIGDVFTVIDNDDADPIIGTFNFFPEGSVVSTNFLGSGLSAVISYVGGSGNDVTLTVVLPPADTSVEVVSGNLIVTDVNGGTSNDTLTITRVGPNIRITDPNRIVVAQAGAIQVDQFTVNVPFTSVTGNLQINTLGGNDTVNLNFASGNPLPAGGLVYNGGVGTEDTFVLSGALTTTASHTLAGPDSGSIVLTGDTAGTITYTGVEPIVDSLEVANREFTFSSSDDEVMLSDAAGTNQAFTFVSGRTVTFFNPSASLMLNGAAGNDTLTLASTDSAFNAALTINGGAGNDSVNINADITFASGRNFDLDLQNDDANPGADSIAFGADAGFVLTGTGSATLRASRNISFATGSGITTINGNLIVEANQQALPQAGDFIGIALDNALLATSGTGTVTIAGRGGNAATGNQVGLLLTNGADIAGGTTGLLSVNGRGGASLGNGNVGVRLSGVGSTINSTGAPLTVTGRGDGTGSGQHGVHLNAGSITSPGGNILVNGFAAGGGSDILISAVAGSTITNTGTGTIVLAGNDLNIQGPITTVAMGSVALRQGSAGHAWNLGVDLTDTELDLINTTSLTLGDAAGGALTISAAITRPSATALTLLANGPINFTTGSLSSGGGNVLLNATSALSFATTGVDLNLGLGTLTFGSGDDLVVNVSGPTVDTQYPQLNIAGIVNLNGVDLVVTGSVGPDDSYIIVNNDGSDAVVGTFNGLPEGSAVLVNGIYKRVTYVGGSGNDVVLEVANNFAPTINALSDLIINEDAPLQTVNLTGITAGGADTQALLVTASSNNPGLIPNPTVTYSSPNATGSLSFTPVPEASGVATISVTVRDAGFDNTLNTADDGLTTTSFTVTVNFVNDQPSFIVGLDQLVSMNAGPQTVTGWATGISPGPNAETSQVVSFVILSNDNPSLFATPPAVSSNGTLTYTSATDAVGSATITLVARDDGGTANGGVDTSLSQTFTITVGSPNSLRVTNFTSTRTGFVIEFNKPFNPAGLNIYDTQGGGIGPLDVVLARATVGLPNIRGSLIVDPTATKITFVATAGQLPADDYTVTLRSAVDGFIDTTAGLLDGNSNGVTGDDYVHTFTVTPTIGAVVVSIPNFARGPQQPVNVPATATTGIPVTISDASQQLSVRFQLRYNPALLNITGASVVPELEGVAFVSLVSFTPGVADIQFVSQDPLPAGPLHFINLAANVPSSAPYRSKHVLDLVDVTLTDDIPGIDDDAVHVVAYFGDTTANGSYSSQDASRLSRVAVGLDGGFAQYKLLDPVIIADLSQNGAISATDTSRMLQVAVALPVADVPPLPSPAVSLVQGGPDPKLSIPRNLSAAPGEGVQIPVDIDSILDLTGTGVESADLVIYYDPAVLEITGATLGSLLPEGKWMIATRIDPLSGRVFVSVAGSEPLEGFFQGELVKLYGTVKATAPAGASAINLAQSSREPSRFTQLNEGYLTLIPAPSDAATDAVDGLLTILPSPAATQPAARLVGDRLIVRGTPGDDRLFVAPVSPSEVRVRLGNRVLGTFPTPAAIAIDTLGGSDYVVAAPSLTGVVIATPAEEVALSDAIFAGPTAHVVDSPLTPEELAVGSPSGVPGLSQHDLALLQLLDQWTGDEPETTFGGTLRRRR